MLNNVDGTWMRIALVLALAFVLSLAVRAEAPLRVAQQIFVAPFKSQ